MEHRPNHYKGHEGYGNYGYFQVKDCWVDPESQKEIHDAWNNSTPTVPKLPIGIPPCPVTYADELYDNFIAEMSGEDGDGDGDPRATYITPAIFARWAASVSKGDCYEETKVPPQVSHYLHLELEINSLRSFEKLPIPHVNSFRRIRLLGSFAAAHVLQGLPPLSPDYNYVLKLELSLLVNTHPRVILRCA